MRKIIVDCLKKYSFIYNLLKSFQLYIYYMFRVNLVKTVYYNFRILPLKQAFMLPIGIGWNVSFRKYGTFIIDSSSIKPFMLSFGVLKVESIETNHEKIIFSNYGTIKFCGQMKIHPGAKLWIREGAKLLFKRNNTIGARSILVCERSIEMGFNTGCSWDCQIFDTDFHYLIDVATGDVYPKVKKVFIGNRVFIGNHVNISKGTKIPDGCVISSWSKVFGSYMRKGENLLISGNPAKLIDAGLTMTHGYDGELEREYSQKISE